MDTNNEIEGRSLTKQRLQEKDRSTDSYDEQDEDEGSLSESSGTSGTGTQSKSVQEEGGGGTQFARKETEQICWLRGTVAVVMLLATFMVSVVIYYSTRKSEIDQFEAQFEDHATAILSSFDSKLREALVSMDNMAVSLTSLALTNSFQWPFASLPSWTVRAASTSQSAAATFLAYAPLVIDRQREGWENYALQFKGWIEEGNGKNETLDRRDLQEVDFSQGIASKIYKLLEDGTPTVEDDEGSYYPIWQNFGISPELVNFNLLSHWAFGEEAAAATDSKAITIGRISEFNITSLEPEDSSAGEATATPIANIYFPIFSAYDNADLVALVIASVDWADYLQEGILADKSTSVLCILTNGCGQTYSYRAQEETVVFLGEGDRHDPAYDGLELSKSFDEILTAEVLDKLSYSKLSLNSDFCPYSLHIYPEAEEEFYTNRPTFYTVLVVIVFIITSCAFVGYDYLVERRQKVVLNKAVRSHQIVASLFPAVVRNRLFGDDGDDRSVGSSVIHRETGKMRIKNYLDTGTDPVEKKSTKKGNSDTLVSSSKPIADLFPHTTVLFADLAGFTAWSSVREPAQVFMLLETLYAAFDQIAVRKKVFKVETIGDCYVAVTGLPIPQANHAVIMARFAAECMVKTEQLAQALVPELGPDTAELCIRVGLHSGAVTAGVLRGQKSRFQLFGDTVNTASRMESNGTPRKIQCSKATADLLVEAGKSGWLTAREDKVHAKGKGDVQTYWVTPKITSHRGPESARSSDNESVMSSNAGDETERLNDDDPGPTKIPTKISKTNDQLHRLVQWNYDLMTRQIRVVLAKRATQSGKTRPSQMLIAPTLYPDTMHPREEYSKIIELPRFDAKSVIHQVDPSEIQLDEAVKKQLLDFVTRIGTSYHQNPFHNFEHATHVSMSANKILSNIVAAEDCHVAEDGAVDAKSIFRELHDFTFGITSDPLTHLACLFSCMIHDVDHCGISNMQLAKEKDELAIMYENKSVLEQNSIDLAWEMLMEPTYADLRKCLFLTEEDIRRFRKLVVNSVMATDIFDPELKALRNNRWDEAFQSQDHDQSEIQDLKATIVIEHIIQAADVAHTMQHWHVYQKWNKRLFQEMHKAYKAGRMDKDPSAGWFQGELWFFDNYVIPLAKKLKDCGVFGTSSDEFLQYATNNRAEWAARGEEILKEMITEVSS